MDAREAEGRDLLGRAARWAARHARRGDREDAAQEFAAAYLAAEPRARAAAQLDAYRHVTADYAARRLLRATRREHEALRDFGLLVSSRDGAGDAGRADSSPKPPVLAALQGAFAALSPRRQQILILRYVDDLSLRACGRALGMSGDGVRHAETRALAILRRRLQLVGIGADAG